MTTINAAALKYPFDRTGTATTNLVLNEARSVGREVYRALAPYAGSFYSKSMVVSDAATNTPLVLNTDYKLVYPNQEAELEIGKPICTVVMILNSAYTDVLLTYQAVGGPYTTSNDVIAQLLVDIQQDNRAVTWDAILGKPVTFNPSKHLHAATDLYGLEYVVLALEELVQSVYSGDVSSHDVLYDYINRIKDSLAQAIVDFDADTANLQALIDQLNTRLTALTNTVAQLRADFTAHVNNKANPHAVTQAQVGLGLVSNYRVATQVEAETGTAANVYMTALTTWQAVTKYTALNITPVITTHINDKTNPHAVTATQVGLGLVSNFRLATQAEAEAGTAANVYMTALLTWQAVTKYVALNVTPALTSHINNHSNPHGVTAAQVGLGSVNNVPQVQRGGGTGMGTNSILMGWDGGKVLIQVDNSPMGQVHTTQQPDPNVTSHIANRNNPHGVTTGQIGAVPTTRAINGHQLTGDFNISANEVGAYSSGQSDNLFVTKGSLTAVVRQTNPVWSGQIGGGAGFIAPDGCFVVGARNNGSSNVSNMSLAYSATQVNINGSWVTISRNG